MIYEWMCASPRTPEMLRGLAGILDDLGPDNDYGLASECACLRECADAWEADLERDRQAMAYEGRENIYLKKRLEAAEQDIRGLWDILGKHDNAVDAGHYCDVLGDKARGLGLDTALAAEET